MDSLVNGLPADVISVHDRGLAYGDGVFETIAVRKGEPLFFAAHMQRLRHGCGKLGIPTPDVKQCRDEMGQVSSGRSGVVKLIMTRGSAGRGYAGRGDTTPNRIVLFSEWEGCPRRYYTEGVHLGICRTRIATQEQLAGIKHLNRLENVMAAREFDGELIQEGIMLDHDNRIIECTRSNIFFIKDGTLHTPDLKRGGISGVMRGYILERARSNGLQAFIRDIVLEESARMDGAFVCNSLIGAWPVARMGDNIFFQSDMFRMIHDWTAECALGYGQHA